MEQQQPQQMHQASAHQAPAQQTQQQQQPQYEDEYEEYEDYDGPVIQQKALSTTDQVISEMKGPLLVILLVFLTNFGMLNQMLAKNVPRLAGGDSGLNMMGLVVKALLAGIVFYVVKRFLL